MASATPGGPGGPDFTTGAGTTSTHTTDNEVPPQLAASMSQIEFSDVFSVRTPQNVIAGVSSGLKSAMKGVVGGAVALVALPVGGFKEGGAKGLATGAVAGLVGCGAIAGTGIVVGATQMVRGIANTPSAIHESIAGERRWDNATRKWVKDDLETDKREMRDWMNDDDILEKARERYNKGDGDADGASPAVGGAPAGPRRQVKDTALYEALGVTPDATDSQIKKAYYVAATRCHPDKCQDDDAKEQFQKLSSAYQVLGDKASRAKYDKEGAAGVEEKEEVHPDMIYTSLFGSEVFEPFIGKLLLSTYFMQNVQLTRDEMREMQRRREVRVAVHLVTLLRPYVDGHKEAFEEAVCSLAVSLASASFGARLLLIIGREYEYASRRKLGAIDSTVARAQSMADHMKSYGKIVSTSVAEAYKAYKASNAGEGPPSGASAVPTLNNLAEVAFEATYLDISKTLECAIERVLHDSAPKGEIRSRAEGLLVLGRLFQEIGAKETDDKDKGIEEQLQEAMLRARQQQDAQEHGHYDG